MKVIKRDGKSARFSRKKIEDSIKRAFQECEVKYDKTLLGRIISSFYDVDDDGKAIEKYSEISIEMIQDAIEHELMASYPYVAKAYIIYRENHRVLREYVQSKEDFINKYKASSCTANATIDDNSNVQSKNIGVLNNEIHKQDNLQVNRGMVMRKFKQLFPDDDPKQYIRDLDNHIIYKHDESSFAGAIAPYCVSVTMYPFLTDGIKGIGGLSAAPKNLDSFCGMFINLIFAVSSQFAGAVACGEALLYFTHFAKKEWGDDFFKRADETISIDGKKTIRKQIHQYFQQIIYSINQPAAARGMQSAFVNFSYFDRAFFEGMFGEFVFPDGTRPDWESLSWIQKEFMMWFNQERLRCVLTFPVESFALVYKDGSFLDQDSADFVAEEYARGHSFFTYISDSVDSLSSCCRLKNKINTREFNFTNGNIGIQTGSKSVITLNLNRIIQDWWDTLNGYGEDCPIDYDSLCSYIRNILERVYKYHICYNELLWDMYDANLLSVYKAGFINLNRQYLTIGINGLNEAAEFLKIDCNENDAYREFCQRIFGCIKDENSKHNVKFNGHKLSFNTECVPAESLAIKNYNWDKEDGYWVPENRNLYASYIFIPSDRNISLFEKMRLHGSSFVGDYLDGGQACHINLEEHLTKEQYAGIIEYAARVGCSYFTFNIPMSECAECGFIANRPLDECPKCNSHKIIKYTRIIGYLTAIPGWSEGRKEEYKTRVFEKIDPKTKIQ